MKLIKKYQEPNWTKEVECYHCFSLLEVSLIDLKVQRLCGRYGEDDYSFTFVCCQCDKHNRLYSLPKEVQTYLERNCTNNMAY